MEFVKTGDSVLVLWANNSGIEKLVENIKSISNVNVNIENVERLSLAGYPSSTFDVILSNLTSCPTLRHNNELLAKLLKLLKPNGTLILREPVAAPNDMSLNIKTSGFTAVSEAKPVELSDEVIEDLKSALNAMSVNVNEFKAQKPNFEVGSSVKLSFASKSKAAAVWKLDDSDDEVIDSDNLLDDDDLVKPDPASLRVCGTTGKRKACKDCSCGLAEELKAEGIKSDQNQTQKSSCGSCYLGDAFRCATCPYLGMPAFKPGEKIQLSDRQLKADS